MSSPPRRLFGSMPLPSPKRSPSASSTSRSSPRKPLRAQIVVSLPTIVTERDVQVLISDALNSEAEEQRQQWLLQRRQQPNGEEEGSTSDVNNNDELAVCKPEDVEVVQMQQGSLVVEFDVRNAHHLYRSNEEVAAKLQNDLDFRSSVAKSLLVHKGTNFTFVSHSAAIQPRDFMYLQTTEFFSVIDRALSRIAATPQNDEDIDPYLVILEILAPEQVAASRRALNAKIDEIVELRQMLYQKGGRDDLAELERRLVEERQIRRRAELDYQTALEEEDKARRALKAREAEAGQVSDEIRRLRTQVIAVERQVEMLKKELAQKEKEQRAVTEAREADVETLLSDINAAEAELDVWTKRLSEAKRMSAYKPTSSSSSPASPQKPSLDKKSKMECEHHLWKLSVALRELEKKDSLLQRKAKGVDRDAELLQVADLKANVAAAIQRTRQHIATL